MHAEPELDLQRIEHLLNRDATKDLSVTIAGLGSGGAPVVQLLAMCGIRRWYLFDPDILEPVNLVKHPGLRSQLGRPKTEIVEEWIADRNPAADVVAVQETVQESTRFSQAVMDSDLVIGAVDDGAARSFINETCVETETPCVSGMVFRTGFGGQVYAYLPGETGCYSCMERYTERAGFNLDDLLDLTPEENRRLYGLGEKDFGASGLAMDISLIATLHAHMALSVLIGSRDTAIPPLSFNCLSFGMRPLPGAFDSRFEARRLILRPQVECHLACGGAREPSGELPSQGVET